ncbi:SDR family oxidoreductase [Acetobacter sp. UBA5411]|uniref:SDR family oxidoreductase n=1 Tax=Acetobacter sp. UBA5411 TaxID=1945905 RepID=UPI0025BEA270|nr:SDR family oxidoreductase [Acetobacter sp. UBA5411]
MSSLDSKSVLVLGGSRGIGAAIVRRFAADGAKVIFTYLSSPDDAQALAAETGSKAMHADSGDRDALIALIGSLGPLDVLVVNSGILGAGDPLHMPPDDIDRLFRINIHAPYHAAVAAARSMPDGGRIIFIGSANADRMPMTGLAAYSASKSALKGMAKGLARDFGARSITVNVVQPGPTDTDMNPADGPLKDVMHDFMAIKRHATGAEIAGLVAYLAGPEAGIITGAAYTIDGGFSV